MTIRAIAGLVGLNVFLLAVGAALLWGIRGWRWWTELARLAGLAYLLGVAALMVALTAALSAGIPFGGATIVLVGSALAAGGLAAGWWKRRAAPGLRPAEWRVPRLSLLGGVLGAALAVYFEALFRSARLSGLSEWDAWWCWTARAKALYFFGGLDAEVFAFERCPGYPPGFSALESAGFHAMGSVDVVTLHVQYWFLLLGFVGAVVGLLAAQVRQGILLPVVALGLVMPSVTERATDGRADLPLAYLVGSGAVLVVLWLGDRETWRLAASTVLLAGAIVTKREGVLLVGFVLGAAAVASWRERRSSWPPLAGVAVAAFALTLPWRAWLLHRDLPSGAPETGYLGAFDRLDRAWPSLRLVVQTFLEPDLWLLAVPLALAATLLAALAGATRYAVFTSAFLGAAVAGCTWVIWSDPSLEITQDYGLNPVVRFVGGPVLVAVVLTPLVLERALTRSERSLGPPGRAWMLGAGLVPWALVAAAALAYPASMLVGYSGFRLPGGLPTFPTPDECVAEPIEGNPVRVVLGYRESYADADALRARAAAAGISDARTERDGCGRLRVYVEGAASVAASRDVLAAARAADLAPALERDPDP